MTDGPGQHKFVPHVDQLIDVHVVADIIGGAFAQNLLVHADPILADIEVVGLQSSTPPYV